ncbi:hypothetical protein [Streptomyces sp. NPDC059575]|uniref:hypothetical protein n=1 Tax=Streptomyces sp. NPDC059575 TaxID=3346872 RepID=UPI003676FDB5
MSTAPPPERSDESDEPVAISDEQWDTFLRDTVEGGGPPGPKEPSARARMVARRLREEGEREAAAAAKRRFGRRGKAAQTPVEPPGWRTGPTRQEKRRGPLWAVLGVVLAVAVCLIALRPSLLLDHIPGGRSGAGASPSPLPAETALPSAAPGDTDGEATLAHPFRGSPAESWDEGADAIELPEAKAVKGFSKADVALALRLTKEFLVGTNLDPEVLRGGQPDKALALLDPKQPETLEKLRRSLRDPDAEHDPIPYVSRFDPARVRLVGDVVKVRGHMSFAAGRPGEVKVHADYTFVYPLVQRASGDDDGVVRSIVRRDVTMELHDPAKWAAVKGKLAVGSVSANTYNNECGVSDGYLHPLFPGDTPAGTPASGDPEDPYNRSEALDNSRDGVCGRLARS